MPSRDEPTNPPSASALDADDSILDSQGLVILRQLFGDDDDDFEFSTSEAPDPTDTAQDDNDDDDNDDNDDNDNDEDDDDEFEDVDEHSDSVPPPDVESQPLFTSTEPDAADSDPPDIEIKDAEANDAVESQILFSSVEVSDQPSHQPSDQFSEPPADQPSDQPPPESKEESGFGPMRTTRRSLSRRHPAPMPEPLEALHRRATHPAPVPSGRVARPDPAVPAESRSGLPPPSDPGIYDPGPAT